MHTADGADILKDGKLFATTDETDGEFMEWFDRAETIARALNTADVAEQALIAAWRDGAGYGLDLRNKPYPTEDVLERESEAYARQALAALNLAAETTP
jgi:hypothetical protein